MRKQKARTNSNKQSWGRNAGAASVLSVLRRGIVRKSAVLSKKRHLVSVFMKHGLGIMGCLVKSLQFCKTVGSQIGTFGFR